MTMRIFVSRDAGAVAVGADEVALALEAAASHARHRRSRSSGPARAGSIGSSRWSRSRRAQGRIAFGPVTAADARSVFDAMACRRPAPAAAWRRGRDSLAEAPDPPDLRALRRDRSALARRLPRPWRLQGPRAGAGARRRTQILDDVTASGLRGRGGAGFPTGIKWKTVAQTQRRPEIHRLQRRRRRQRHLRRPHDHGRRSLRADRGHDDRRHRGRRRPRATSTSARNIRMPSPR